MFVAKVRGTVVSTSKDERLVGFKLMIVQRLGLAGEDIGKPELAVDSIGAGVGETVIVTSGSSARFAAARPEAPIDATIVGIIDTIEIEP